jgi:hypothetical protein
MATICFVSCYIASEGCCQPLLNITSVDLITTFTASPTFNSISSALRRVITLSTSFSPTLTVTCAMIEPIVTSVTRPGSWFRADNAMRVTVSGPQITGQQKCVAGCCGKSERRTAFTAWKTG